MKKGFPFLASIAMLLALAVQAKAIMYYTLDTPNYPGVTSNSIIDIAADDIGIWLGSGGGPSFSSDTGNTWQTFNQISGLGSNQVSALATGYYGGRSIVWMGTSHSVESQGSAYPFGDGLVRTTDHGATWETVRKPEQCYSYGKLSYDLAIYRDHVYSACFYGGLIRSADNGLSWQSLWLNASDSSDYASQTYVSLSNRYFSVKIDLTLYPETISVWGGTALGINRFIFTDYDNLAAKQDTAIQYYYNTADTTVPAEHRLPGNFVVAIGINKPDSTTYIWAACRPGGGDTGQKFSLAYSKNYGRTWTSSLEATCWDFSFIGDTVFAATDDGLAISIKDSASGDYINWRKITTMVDTSGLRSYYESPFYAVDVIDGVVWAGGADGTVRLVPGDTTFTQWSVYRSQINPDEHYAYPTPFSPYTSTRKGTTIHFKPTQSANATVKIFDFNLDLVRTLVNSDYRTAGLEYDIDVWDGRNDEGKIVANGVYFYNIKLSSGEDWWGKMAVIK
jgi:hypothetical protein